MTRRFEEILDECIDRIVQKHETAEQCLALYPEHAAQLEPELRAVAQALNVFQFTPSPEAKARGRLRLQREMEVLQRAKPSGRWPRLHVPSMALGWQAKWATGIAVVLVALSLGSTGVVAASSDAIPGDTLYSVKTAAEELRLALEFSPKEEAELHLKFAERRTGEISELIEQGKEKRLPETQRKLENHLNKAVSLTKKIDKEEVAVEVRAKLEDKAYKSLAALSVNINTDAPNRSAALENLEQASGSYSRAIETIAEQAPKPENTVGALQIRVSESKIPGLERLTIEITDLEVFRVDGHNKGWVVVGPGPHKLDLVRVEGVQTFLGEAQVVAGSYTKLRFRVMGATAVLNGVEVQPRVSSERVLVNRPFNVKEGEVTLVVLEFDPRASLQRGDSGQFILNPKLRVLVGQLTEKTQPREKDNGKNEGEEDEDNKSTSKGSEDGQSTTRPLIDVEVTGVVEKITSEALTLKGKEISIAKDTQISGELKEGSWVEIRAVIQRDGSVVGLHVVVIPPVITAPQKPVEESGPTLEFSGVVESMVGNVWTVSGLKVQVNKDTEAGGHPVVGSLVEIEGIRLESDVILAVSVEVKEPPEPTATPNEPVRFSGEIMAMDGERWFVGEYTVIVSEDVVLVGSPEIGATALIQGQAQLNQTVIAEVIKVLEPLHNPSSTTEPSRTKTPEPTKLQPIHIEYKGVLRNIRPGRWLVGDHEVVLTAETVIEGIPVLGAEVTIVGVEEPNGDIKALKVSVEALVDIDKLVATTTLQETL